MSCSKRSAIRVVGTRGSRCRCRCRGRGRCRVGIDAGCRCRLSMPSWWSALRSWSCAVAGARPGLMRSPIVICVCHCLSSDIAASRVRLHHHPSMELWDQGYTPTNENLPELCSPCMLDVELDSNSNRQLVSSMRRTGQSDVYSNKWRTKLARFSDRKKKKWFGLLLPPEIQDAITWLSWLDMLVTPPEVCNLLGWLWLWLLSSANSIWRVLVLEDLTVAGLLSVEEAGL